MSFSSKSKFAGFLRGLIGRSDDRASARPVASAAPASASAPAPLMASAVTAGGSRTGNTSEIELPLGPVLAALPIEFRAKLMATPSAGQGIYLQADMVINQLAFGAVKITFGDLRRMAPGIFANTGGELDSKLVNLPLQEILPRISSTLLARRSLRRVEVSDDIVGPFSERGRGFSFTTQPLKAAAPVRTPQPEPEPTPATPIPFTQPPLGVRPAAPAPMAPPTMHRAVTPAAPAPGTNGSSQGHTTQMAPFGNRSVKPAQPMGPNGHTNGSTNGNTNGYGNGHVHEPTNGHGQTMTPGLRLGPLNGSGHVEPPTPGTTHLNARPAPSLPPILVSMGDLCESWPDSLRAEIMSSPLAQANVPLDPNIVIPGLKRGRVVMPWKYLRLLAAPSSTPSTHDHLELELPLKVLAPLFLATQKNLIRPQYRGQLSTDIPDLFFGFPQPAPAAPAAPAAPVAPIAPAAPVAPPVAAVAPTAPVVPPLPKPVERAQDTNFYVWGENGEAPQTDEIGLRRHDIPQTDFLSRQTQPKDVVMRAVALSGVAGSVVAMPDGMRVASQVPVELNADTVAAFLPQIFDRVNQSTRELRMGPLNNVNFTVGNVPWKIFRVNAVYFAAFGRAGEQLPSAQLAQLAAELDRKK